MQDETPPIRWWEWVAFAAVMAVVFYLLICAFVIWAGVICAIGMIGAFGEIGDHFFD